MDSSRNLLARIFIITPPVASALAAWIVYARSTALTLDTESGIIALSFACIVSGVYAMRLLLASRNEKSHSAWISGFDIVVLPFVVLEVAVGSSAIGWCIGTIVVLFETNTKGARSARQLVLPFVGAAATFVIWHLQVRPTKVQRIWQLADSSNGERKLQKLYHSAKAGEDHTTLHAMAKMPRMKPALLELLAANSDPETRGDVANNPNAPAELLVHLSHDPVLNVRRAIAFNASASADLLRTLMNDVDESVREKAASRLLELPGA